MLGRYVHGLSAGNDPLVSYDGSSASIYNAEFLFADLRGSIIHTTDRSGGSDQINTYDEFGVPGDGNAGRFGYTGQTWVPELGMWYYKARMYAPSLGRFMQTDPIGYGDGMNMYAYVGNDPVNGVDPTGLEGDDCPGDICVDGSRPHVNPIPAHNAGTAEAIEVQRGRDARAREIRAAREAGMARIEMEQENGPCATAIAASGDDASIELELTSGGGTIILGFQVTTGTFHDLSTGYRGEFSAISFNAGLGGGLSSEIMVFNGPLGALVGGSDYGSLTANIGPLYAGVQASRDSSGRDPNVYTSAGGGVDSDWLGANAHVEAVIGFTSASIANCSMAPADAD